MTQRIIKFRAWDGHSMDYNPRISCGCGDGLSGLGVSVNDISEIENVMQFTGLLDKNGKEIYEGDIVQICPEDDYDHMEDKLKEFADSGWKKVEVKYDIGMAGYFFDGEELFGHEYNYPIVADTYVTEIIGNIYQNPELLK